MSSPANSRPDAFDVALIGLSVRALARSARRAGLRALTLDLFADADTREHAALAVRVDARRRGFGFDAKALATALETYAPAGLPVVFGAGFEDATGLMATIGRRHPIRGAAPETVARLKDPFAFAGMLKALEIEHPNVAELGAIPPLAKGRVASPKARSGGDRPGLSSTSVQVGFFRLGPCARANSATAELAAPPDLGYRRGHPPHASREEGCSGWLSKRAGGSGGAHIHAADGRVGRRRYAQRRLAGSPFSALFLADGRQARVIGFSEQWADPTAACPFRYGGAVGPVAVPAARSSAVAAALDRIVAATGLVGLASADMLAPVEGGAGFTLLEINPRPCATLDLFDRADAPSLLAAHLAACDGRLAATAPEMSGAQAAAIVYAPRRTSVAGLERPSWTADWPADGDMIPAGAPVCTALAAAYSPAAARALVDRRRAALLASLPFVRRSAAVPSSKAMATT